MKQHLRQFIKQGLLSAAGGPIVLAIIYAVLGGAGTIDKLSPGEVSLGIVTLALLAFLAGGINVVYKIERLPLFSAIVIHGAVLYLIYLTVYLVNGWLKTEWVPFLIFTAVFLLGYAVIWCLIYFSIRAQTKQLNKKIHS